MSEHDAERDPIDAAYDRAETMLSDDDARAARRARVLSAVAAEPTAMPRKRSVWRRGGWLAAASVAGLATLIGTQVYPPALRQTPPVTAVPPRSVSAARPVAPSPTAAAPSPLADRRPSPSVHAPTLRSLPNSIPSPPRPPQAAPAPSPPVTVIAPVPLPVPAPPPPPPPPPPPTASADAGTTVGEVVVVTAEKRRANLPSLAARPAFKDPGERLRAAAAGGRVPEIDGLLSSGAPIDGADADGNTALMLAVRADRPDAAALLIRHGASLDLRNKAGETARSLAAKADDPAVKIALGLTP